MKIGELARKTGLPIATLRFYEMEGLLDSQRSSGDYRDFPEEAVAQAERIRLYRSLDLTLPEIRSMLRLAETPASSCGQVCELIGHHLEKVRRQRERLQHLEIELQRLLTICPGPTTPGDCQILAELAGSRS